MATADRPESEAALASLIGEAARAGTPLELVGAGSKRAYGRPVQAARTIRLDGLSGIVDYAPSELHVTARAGTPLAEIEAALAEAGQYLPFEPPDWRGLLGDGPEPTIGGAVSCNLSGPRRLSRGAARDFVIGLRAVNGAGETITAGGRVMKNVTGYDLCKLLSGSMGTLAALTEVTLKVLPAPETEATLLLPGLDDADAVAAMAEALGEPYDVVAAAHLPAAAVAALPDVAGPGGGDHALTALRLDGFADSVAYRCDALARALGAYAPLAPLDADASAALWRALRDAAPVADPAKAPVWRISTPPSSGAALAQSIAAEAPVARHFLDWAGGLVWLAMDGSLPDAGAETIRRHLAPHGGHATLVRAPEPLRAAVPVFQPPAAPVAALAKRLKRSFDPQGILNPGRLYADA